MLLVAFVLRLQRYLLFMVLHIFLGILHWFIGKSENRTIQTILKLRNWISEKTEWIPYYEFITDVLFYCVSCCMSDLIEQTFEWLTDSNKKYDVGRNLRVSITGISVGIIAHADYAFVESLVPGESSRRAFVKMLLNTAFSMPFEVFTFFGTLGVLEQTFSRSDFFVIVEKSLHLYYTEMMLWPLFHILNFKFIPLKYRVYTDGVFSFGCDIFASYCAYYRGTRV